VPEEEVFIYPNDDKDDEVLINVLRERIRKALGKKTSQ